MANDSWIFEGIYTNWCDPLIFGADLVVWLDPSLGDWRVEGRVAAHQERSPRKQSVSGMETPKKTAYQRFAVTI